MDRLTRHVFLENESLRKIHEKIEKIEDWDLLPQHPKVTICMATYNHENFIGEALESVLMQQTNFDYEIILKEDYSTDRTKEIVIEYQKRFPDKIRLWLCNENLYSQKIKPRLDTFARGKYLARCEGDDFWTDPLKLQKQISFLENNTDYTLVVGGFISKHEHTGKEETIIKQIKNNDINQLGYSFTLENFYSTWITKLLTAVFVNERHVLEDLVGYNYGRDVHLFYHLLRKGKGFYFTEIFGVYRIHTGGVRSMVDKNRRYLTNYNVFKDLYTKNKNDALLLKNNFKQHLVLLNKKIFNASLYPQINIFSLISETAQLVRSPRDVLAFLTAFVTPSFRRYFNKND